MLSGPEFEQRLLRVAACLARIRAMGGAQAELAEAALADFLAAVGDLADVLERINALRQGSQGAELH